jgi:hypothetical protein
LIFGSKTKGFSVDAYLVDMSQYTPPGAITYPKLIIVDDKEALNVGGKYYEII